MVPTSVTSLLTHKLVTGLSREGKAQLPGQLSELHIELALEKVVMVQWLESGRMGRPGGGVTWKKTRKVNTGRVRMHAAILRRVPGLR